MTSLPIESNAAANNVPVSVASDVETEEEDLEQIQRDTAAAQQKIADEAQACVDAAKAQKEQKRLDWRRRQPMTRLRSSRRLRRCGSRGSMEGGRSAEGRSAENGTGSEYPEKYSRDRKLTCIRCMTRICSGMRKCKWGH